MTSTLLQTAVVTARKLQHGLLACLILLAASITSAQSQSIPPKSERDILIRTGLMTFNDANMTGIYTVMHAKASTQFQEQVSIDKIVAAFKPFRDNKLFFESAVTAEFDSQEEPKLDGQTLVLVGVLTPPKMSVKYQLKYVQNDGVWKMIGINVDAKRDVR